MSKSTEPAPALAASGGLWIGISTGSRKTSLLYQGWRDHFGQNSDTLVVQGVSRTFDPSLSQSMIEHCSLRDDSQQEATIIVIAAAFDV